MGEIPKPENLKGAWRVLVSVWLTEVHIGIQQDFIPAKKAHPGFTVNALDQLKSQLVEANYVISVEPPIDGRSRFFTHDPFGNRLEFLAFRMKNVALRLKFTSSRCIKSKH